MQPRKIKNNVYWLGAIDWDRRLFDSLMLLTEGTSYNAYLVQGNEKSALMDTVDPSMAHHLIAQLEPVPRLDYVISHHAEQDHSGTLPLVLEKYPEAKVVTSGKCKGMLMDLLEIPKEKFVTVEDGQTLSLGNKTLRFIYTPWVHWPETMVTYLHEDRILFTCDFFGSHLATSSLYASEEAKAHEGAKKYYAEIMMPFRTVIQKNLEKIRGLEVELIAPSHGPIHDKPASILGAYREWVEDDPRNSVILPYISMHDSTKKMVEYLAASLVDKGVRVQQFDLVVTDPGRLALALVDAATSVFGTPMVLAGPHPKIVYAAYLANALRPKLKFASVIGSYGWSGKAAEQVASFLPNLKLEMLAPVLCKGLPREDDYKALERLAAAITKKHQELRLV